jgi:LPXTG-motif cell wall-anchored protein
MLALAASPAPALAQSASDDVYQDPFANQGQQSGTAGAQSSGSSSSSQGSSGSSAQPTPSAAASQSQTATTGSTSTGSSTSGSTATAPQTEAAAAETATPQNELPRTGADAGLTALAGLGLLLTGAVLRLRARID